MEESEFQTWLEDVLCKYKSVSDEERNSVLSTLIDASTSRQWWYLQQKLRNFLYCDILALLPGELQDYLLTFLDPKLLLNCCRVSQTWNRIITAHANIWYRACKRLDWQFDNAYDMKESVHWKSLYLHLLRFSQMMVSSSAFTSKSYAAQVSRITAVYYWNGKIVTGSDDKTIRIWDAQNDEIFLTINSDCSISGIKMDSHYIIVSSYIGCLKSFSYNSQNHLQTFEHHTGAVFSFDFKAKLNLLVSGGADNLVCLWSLKDGRLLKSLRTHSHWVVDVKLVQDKHFDNTHYLLTMDKENICIFRLTNEIDYDNVVCIQQISIGIPDFNFFTPGLECDGHLIYFIRQDPRKNGYTLLCCWDIYQNKIVKQQEMNMTVKMLLAVGKKFACIITPWIDDDTPNFLVIRMTDFKSVAQWHLPSSSPTTPGNSQLSFANKSWLNGTIQKNQSGIILSAAHGLHNSLLYVLKWKENIKFQTA